MHSAGRGGPFLVGERAGVGKQIRNRYAVDGFGWMAGKPSAPHFCRSTWPGRPFVLTREALHLRAVEARVEDGDIGYLRIAAFNGETIGALKQAIAEISARVPPEPKHTW